MPAQNLSDLERVALGEVSGPLFFFFAENRSHHGVQAFQRKLDLLLWSPLQNIKGRFHRETSTASIMEAPSIPDSLGEWLGITSKGLDGMVTADFT